MKIFHVIIYLANYTINILLYRFRKPCLVTKITKDFDHNRKNKTTTFTFSSDDHSRSTYKCKLDNGKFKQCELIYE